MAPVEDPRDEKIIITTMTKTRLSITIPIPEWNQLNDEKYRREKKNKSSVRKSDIVIEALRDYFKKRS